MFVPSVLSQALAFTSAPASTFHLPCSPPSTYSSSGWWWHLHAGWCSPPSTYCSSGWWWHLHAGRCSPPSTYSSSGWWWHLHAGRCSPPSTYSSSRWWWDVCGRDCRGCCPACKMCHIRCRALCDCPTVSSPVSSTTSLLLHDDGLFHHRIVHDLLAKVHSDADIAMTIWVLHSHDQKVVKGTRLLYPMR